MSKVIANTYRHSGASADAITLDSSGNATFPGNLTVTGSVTGDNNTVYDDTNIKNDYTSIRKDILTLALQTAVDTNRKAYNLQNSFIDQFEDDTGIGTETNTDRNTDNECVGSVQVETIGGSSDPFSKALYHFDGNGTDSSGNTNDMDAVIVGDSTFNATNQKKFGSASSQHYGSNDWTKLPASIDFEPLGGDFTLDFWFRPDATSRMALWASSTDIWWGLDYHQQGTRNINLWASSDGSNWDLLNGDGGGNGIGSTSLALNTWTHVAAVRNGNNWMTFINGVKDVDETVSGSVVNRSSQWKRQGEWGNGSFDASGHIDEVHWRKGKATWTANFTPPTQAYPWNKTVANATGTLIGTANTASSSRTKVSGVITYKNDQGTATLGTDLKIFFTCNGGTNWTEAASYTAGSDFSTGIKTVYLGETTCTAGTDVRYKAEWANQAAGSKETQLYGIGVNY